MEDKHTTTVERKVPEFSPREFLKARRPERFSDSVIGEQPALDRSMLEYHLDTLTNRSQEVQFATFARHLAEREICPNLLPQTGPTGGGDSKVDSETYPVSDEIALGWYSGMGREAASERWGFAFSAKKQWRSKVNSDVAKAAETGRRYTKAFFVTNQYVRDKARAEVEDKLSKQYGLDVRILDRTWILDKVFQNKHEQLAVDDLELQTSKRREIRKGPLDTQREADLTALETRIQEALRDGRFGRQLAEDCIEAADLARQLERPRTEVDGLYDRAEQIVVKAGTDHQRFKCAYQRAWTAYWWHEDYAQFNELYAAAETRAKGTENAYVLELLTNLWSLLHNAVICGKLDEKRALHAARTQLLLKELERISRKEDQPSTALHARSMVLLTELLLNFRTLDGSETTLRKFKDVLRSSEGLAGFPFEPLAQILTELGAALGHLPAYDELFDVLVEMQTQRKKDLAAAQMLLIRGSQQLQADRPYDAIRSLGLSLSRLYKHESRGDAISALYLCGCAYEQVGLLWAARGTLLSAASLATSELSRYGEVTKAQAACYRRLKWVELQLGRISQALSWHEVDMAVRDYLVSQELLKADESWDLAFDGTLGMLFLKTDPWELKSLAGVPDSLEAMGLFNASAAVLYALGHEDELKRANFPSSDTAKELHDYFLTWRNHPSAQKLPAQPSFYEEQRVVLESNILGCSITLDSENSSPCLELSESILAGLESLLSTGTIESMTSREPSLSIKVRQSDAADSPFEFDLQDDTGRPHINVRCAQFDAHSMAAPLQEQYRETLFNLLATIAGRIAAARDMENAIVKLVRDELALDRSVNFTGSFVTVANVLGRNPKTRISNWVTADGHQFPPKRTDRWDAEDVLQQPALEPRSIESGEGEPPKQLRDPSRIKQNEIRTISLIRESLWNKARWSGMGFVTSADESTPPVLALAFKDPEAAKQIFTFWHEELGSRDTKELLRVTIIRSVSRAEPFSYRVVIGSNPDRFLSDGNIRFATLVNRIHTMHPSSDANLERFLSAFNKSREYYLVPALLRGTDASPIEAPYLLKRELNVRLAWQLGRHDLDSTGMKADDVPIIPPDQANPPVMELLSWLQSRDR